MKLRPLIAVAVVVLCRSACPAVASDGQIRVRITDTHGELLPARAWVDAGGRRLFHPLAPESATPYQRDRSFSCDGEFTIAAPAGRAIIHVEKGKEFTPIDVAVDVPSGGVAEKTVALTRWVDMPARGWYSADLHVHFGNDNPRILRQLALADDVHLIPSFTYWLRGTEKSWRDAWPGDEFTRPIRIDGQHLITRNNIEIERIGRSAVTGGTVGATFLYNLTQPVTADRFGFLFPTDAELCRVARRHSPDSVFDSDKPSWAETVIGAALGQLDTIQVCHNHYHRLTTIPGGWGMIGPLEPGESNADVGDGLFHRTNSLYYRLLNCGFRLGVSGGSAIGVMPLPAGYNRTYAQIDGPLTAEKLWAAIRDGRTFATSGPMLSLTADGQPIGSTLSLTSGNDHSVAVRAVVESIDKLESLELVHNGAVVHSVNLTSQTEMPIRAVAEFSLKPDRSGWVAARALFRAPDGLLRQAHTSPVYISVDDQPVASAADARYMLRWIQRLEEIANLPDRFPNEDARRGVLEIYAEARLRYEEVLAASAQTLKWKDLFSRTQPKPDATLAYGDHPLQVVDVWQPDTDGPSPAVIMIHGGCWQTEIAERDIMNWIADDLRQHGIGVWNIEYRGVDREGGFPATYEDVARAADLFREKSAEYGFRSGKTVVIGHSAGGHLALWLANRSALPKSHRLRGDNPIRVDLAISQGGLPDLKVGATRDGHPCSTHAPADMLGPDPTATSPPEMKPGSARQVLFHNSLDRIAPPEYARAYVARLAAKHVTVTLWETAAEGHVELVTPDTRSWARQRDLIIRELGQK